MTPLVGTVVLVSVFLGIGPAHVAIAAAWFGLLLYEEPRWELDDRRRHDRETLGGQPHRRPRARLDRVEPPAASTQGGGARRPGRGGVGGGQGSPGARARALGRGDADGGGAGARVAHARSPGRGRRIARADRRRRARDHRPGLRDARRAPAGAAPAPLDPRADRRRGTHGEAGLREHAQASSSASTPTAPASSATRRRRSPYRSRSQARSWARRGFRSPIRMPWTKT